MPPEMRMPATMSSYKAETDQGKHVFEIFDYSLHKGMDKKKFIRSGTFSVGGCDWAIRYYPDGNTGTISDNISVYLELLSKDTEVRASCDLLLVDQATGLPRSVNKTGLRIFSSTDRFAPKTGFFMTKSELEASSYLRDDHLTIQCIVTVRKKERQVSKTETVSQMEVPPSNIAEHFGGLLDSDVRADVTFSVGGENFAAHRIVLAARSPVFRAELFGPMQEARSEHIAIEDIQPAVFRALMHFIYTDSLPETVDQKDANLDMIQHLLVAADRYAIDRLKILCQSILCKNLNVETVSTALALSYQHNCERLNDICIDFINRFKVMDALVETPGYKRLKRTCPSVLADAFEKSKRFRKT